MELRARFRLIAALGVTLAVVAGATWWLFPRPVEEDPLPIPGETLKGAVEVLNATAVDGLARSVTRRLRAEGIDVVFYGSARDSMLDSTRIIVRRGDTTLAVAVRQVLGTGLVSFERDETRLVDVTVLLHLDAAAVLGLHP